MNEQEKKKIFLLSIKFRGEIIHAVSRLERYLDAYIASYFCSDRNKVMEMADIILGNNRISLDGKRKIFDILIKRKNPSFFKEHPDFSKDMNTVMYERNGFAHNLVAQTDEALKESNGRVGLHKFSSNSRIEWYTEERIKEIKITINKCADLILDNVEPQFNASE